MILMTARLVLHWSAFDSLETIRVELYLAPNPQLVLGGKFLLQAIEWLNTRLHTRKYLQSWVIASRA